MICPPATTSHSLGREMSRSADLNALYEAYCMDRDAGLEPLLAAVSKAAANMFDDQDAAQELIIFVWAVLPTLKIKSSFAAYLHRLASWRRIDGWRRAAKRAEHEQQPPVIIDHDGHQLSDEESLSRLLYESDRDTTVHPEVITSPFIRAVAEMLLDGLTQAEVAASLGLSPVALRGRLYRHRQEYSLAA